MIPAGTSTPRSSNRRRTRCAIPRSARSRKTVRQIVDHYARRRAAPHPANRRSTSSARRCSDSTTTANVESLRRRLRRPRRHGQRGHSARRLARRPAHDRPRVAQRDDRARARAADAGALARSGSARRTSSDVPYGEIGDDALPARGRADSGDSARPVRHAARDAKLGWYARTVDAHALSGKRVGVFGMPSAAAGHRARAARRARHARRFRRHLRARRRRVAARAGRRPHGQRTLTDDFQRLPREIDRDAAGYHVRLADGTPLGQPFRRAVRRHLAAGPHPELPARLRAVLGLRRRQLPRRRREPNAGARARAPPDRDLRPARPRPLRRSRARRQGRAAAPAPPDRRNCAWDPSAERLVGRIPFFVRKKARTNIEKYARERDIAVIDEATVLAAREHVGG